MGTVYKAYDSQIERWVAIKVLNEQPDNDDDIEARFLQEAKAAARCHHPNITTVFDFGDHPHPFMVMEFVQGSELKTYLKAKQNFSAESATHICLQILAALSHAHGQNIVHRDIKPANIMLLDDGRVKVTDFGVAHIALPNAHNAYEGFIMGTPLYMAPEGLEGKPTDARSDLYSLGILYFELLTLCRPDPEKSLEQNLNLLDDLDDTSAAAINSIKGVIRQALQPCPQHRFGSADQFAYMLHSIPDMEPDRRLVPPPILTAERVQHQMEPSATAADATTKLWNQEFILTLESSLAQFIGPMAKPLVQKTCDTSGDLDQLLTQLSQHIPGDKDRANFIRTLSRAGIRYEIDLPEPEPTPGTNSQGEAADERTCKRLTADVESDLRQLLTFYMGPLAGKIMLRQAQRASSLPDLIARLSRQIPNAAERSQFVSKASAL